MPSLFISFLTWVAVGSSSTLHQVPSSLVHVAPPISEDCSKQVRDLGNWLANQHTWKNTERSSRLQAKLKIEAFKILSNHLVNVLRKVHNEGRSSTHLLRQRFLEAESKQEEFDFEKLIEKRQSFDLSDLDHLTKPLDALYEALKSHTAFRKEFCEMHNQEVRETSEKFRAHLKNLIDEEFALFFDEKNKRAGKYDLFFEPEITLENVKDAREVLAEFRKKYVVIQTRWDTRDDLSYLKKDEFLKDEMAMVEHIFQFHQSLSDAKKRMKQIPKDLDENTRVRRKWALEDEITDSEKRLKKLLQERANSYHEMRKRFFNTYKPLMEFFKLQDFKRPVGPA